MAPRKHKHDTQTGQIFEPEANAVDRAHSAPDANIIVHDRSLLIAGVDEAGRGPLAGPVTVAAVILDAAHPIDGLDDSKKLSEAKREALYPLILEHAFAWRIEFVEADEIDRLNILQATLTGMRRALEGLNPQAGAARIDGNKIPSGLPCPAEAIIGGDAIEPAIMAASILAKVARDRRMLELHLSYPQYGFDRHKGYPSPVHLAALREHGPCPEHRRSYRPVRDAIAMQGL
jgi:ribonuclease HII